MTVSERIFMLLDEQNKRQADLVRLLGVRPNTVSDWKAKRRDPNVSHLESIAEFFNVSLDYLVAGKEYSLNGGLCLSRRHFSLLLFIKRAECVALSNVPADLFGDKDPVTGASTACDFLEKLDLICRVADVDVPADKHSNKHDDIHYRVAERGNAYIDNRGGDTASVVNKQGIFGNGNKNNTVTIHGNGTVQLSEFESELLRVYSSLDTQNKTALLMHAYELSRKGTSGV